MLSKKLLKENEIEVLCKINDHPLLYYFEDELPTLERCRSQNAEKLVSNDFTLESKSCDIKQAQEETKIDEEKTSGSESTVLLHTHLKTSFSPSATRDNQGDYKRKYSATSGFNLEMVGIYTGIESIVEESSDDGEKDEYETNKYIPPSPSNTGKDPQKNCLKNLGNHFLGLVQKNEEFRNNLELAFTKEGFSKEKFETTVSRLQENKVQTQNRQSLQNLFKKAKDEELALDEDEYQISKLVEIIYSSAIRENAISYLAHGEVSNKQEYFRVYNKLLIALEDPKALNTIK